MLGHVGAVEQHRVVAGLSFEGVAAVAGIPDEGVVAGTEERAVVAAVAVDRVVALAAQQQSRAFAAGDRVVSRCLRRSWSGCVSVKEPLPSSIRTRSFPALALTVIFVTSLRATEKLAEPSSPTSI